MRVGFSAALILWLCVLSYPIEFAFNKEITFLHGVYAFNIVISAIAWGASKTKGASHNVVLAIGLVYEVILCLSVSTGFVRAQYLETQTVPLVTWSSILMVLFPLIIPSAPRLTFVVAMAAAAMAPLSVLLLDSMGEIAAAPISYAVVCVTPAMAVVVAVLSSRVVFELNVDVARARQLGSYRLVELIGRGGMGEVWRAEHRMLARPAAVKLIRSESLGTGDAERARTALKRFEKEAQATARLLSPHTIGIYDFGLSEDGTFYYVMELLDGVDLHTLVERHGRLPPERVAHLIVQACHSLEEAHAAGLVHRDIKPANIFLCQYGLDSDFVKILDFGLVKERRRDQADEVQLTRDDIAVGTPAFMSPDLAVGDKPLDGRCDLYALGCVAYWLLTGKLVFEADSAMKMAVKHATETPESPSARGAVDLPRDLERAVMACLEKDPEDRPKSARALAKSLTDVTFADPWTRERADAWWRDH